MGLHDGDTLCVYAAHVAVFKQPNLHETQNCHKLHAIVQQVFKLNALLSQLLQTSSCRVCITHLMHSVLCCVQGRDIITHAPVLRCAAYHGTVLTVSGTMQQFHAS